jgi:hypothetical protein
MNNWTIVKQHTSTLSWAVLAGHAAREYIRNLQFGGGGGCVESHNTVIDLFNSLQMTATEVSFKGIL